MITGDANNPVFNTGFFIISSSLAYLDFKSEGEPDVAVSDPQDDNGNVAAAMPPATAVDMNLRRFVLISAI